VSINASDSVMTVVDFPAAITPTISPVSEIKNRSMRSPPISAGWVPDLFSKWELYPKFRTVAVPLEYLQNRPTIPRLERQICKENKTLYECALEMREAGFLPDEGRGITEEERAGI